MGPVFANLLEIGGDQYEYIQSAIFKWVQPLLINSRIGGERTHEKRPDIDSQTVSSILKIRSEVWRPNHLCLTLI